MRNEVGAGAPPMLSYPELDTFFFSRADRNNGAEPLLPAGQLSGYGFFELSRRLVVRN